MKIAIRRGVFETNSSSTHSISIQNNRIDPSLIKSLILDKSDFGWRKDEYTDAQSRMTYLNTYIEEYAPKEQQDKFHKMLESISQTYGVEFLVSKNSEEGYIDHAELKEFAEYVLSSEDKLLQYLYGKDSCIRTSSDCEDDYWEFVEKDENNKAVTVFYKGN